MAWTTGGPPDDVTGLAINSVTSTLYAVGRRGVYRSLDEGSTWATTAAGANLASPTAVAVGPTGLVYVGTIRGGLSVTANGGTSWTTLLPDNPLPNAISVDVIAPDPVTVTTLYIKGSGFTGPGPIGALLRSRDGGTHFSTLDPTPAQPYEISSIAFDSHVPETIYAAAGTWGVLKSADGGDTFSPVGGLGDADSVHVVEVEPPPTSIVLAGTETGLYRSVDAGASFSRVDLGYSPVVVRDIKGDARRPGRLYLATGNDGVLATANGGLGWYPLNYGLPSLSAWRLAVDPAGTSLHAIGNWTGVFDYQIGNATCLPDETAACLQDARFRVSVAWSAPGQTGLGRRLDVTGNRRVFGSSIRPTSSWS